MRLCVCVYKQGSYCLYGKDQNPLFHWLRPVPPRGPIEHLPLCRLTRFHPGSERGCCRPAGLHKLIFRPENASFQPTLPPRTNYTHAETHTVPSPTQCSALIHFPHTHVHNALCTTALGLGSAQLFSDNKVRLLQDMCRLLVTAHRFADDTDTTEELCDMLLDGVFVLTVSVH